MFVLGLLMLVPLQTDSAAAQSSADGSKADSAGNRSSGASEESDPAQKAIANPPVKTPGQTPDAAKLAKLRRLSPTPEERAAAANIKDLWSYRGWGDTRHFCGFRIQKHIEHGQYRLLSPDSRLVTWGELPHCENRLTDLCQEFELEPEAGTAVILLHGLGNSPNTMSALAKHFRDSGVAVFNISYPSTEATLDQSAQYLAAVLESLPPEISKLSLVGFSMGGIVIRKWLEEHQDERLSRIVFIGSPHNGAELVDQFQNNPLFLPVFGPGAVQLAQQSKTKLADLPIPKVEFAVIAGRAESNDGYNPLIPGDDDGLVSVAAATLPGATDHIFLKLMHPRLPFDERVLNMTQRFLENGHLRTDEKPVPMTPFVAPKRSKAKSKKRTAKKPDGESPETSKTKADSRGALDSSGAP